MPKADDIRWFKQQFHREIEAAVQGTPFTLDLVTAVACQETGFIWSTLRKKNLPISRVLELCVGDVLDESRGRKAFPKTKALLLAKPNGQRMFDIARKALEDMSQFIGGYQSAVANPEKFCHGFGIFQYDLQFFLSDPDYFLEKRYTDFNVCVKRCVGELRNAMRRNGWQSKTALTDYEMACVAIAYNAGRFKPSKGLKQGHFNGSKYYGEQIFDFLRLSQTVPLPGAAAPPPASGPTVSGPSYVVDVRDQPLRLRREPKVDADDPNGNVIARLPDGQIVRAVTEDEVDGFLEVETSLMGAQFRGFASAQFLKPVSGVQPEAAEFVLETADGGIPAVSMPRRTGTVTRRTGIAGAHSLNEPDQPGRRGTSPDELREELAAILDWLAVDDPAHVRYQPRNRSTFCNVYAHDYCHLAGVYLPRVWWTPGAIESLASGQRVEPLLEATIEEMRANGLFRWLRDFGPRFGWRQIATLSELQLEVNQGAIGLIAARRREDGPPGHITMVVPETESHRARRNAAGEVTAPLQSQAGRQNFRRGTGRRNWWLDDQFADSAFWLHA